MSSTTTPARAGQVPSDSDSDSDSASSQGYEDVPGAEDDEETAVPAVCLFCELTLPSAHGIFVHCAQSHGFDWKTTVKTLGGPLFPPPQSHGTWFSRGPN